MDRPEPEHRISQGSQDEEPSKGPNLVLLYSLLALALLVAIFCAGMIVLPFYLHR